MPDRKKGTVKVCGSLSSFDRIIDNHIKNLKQKIEDDTKNPVYVLTIRGLGYKFGGD